MISKQYLSKKILSLNANSGPPQLFKTIKTNKLKNIPPTYLKKYKNKK